MSTWKNEDMLVRQLMLVQPRFPCVDTNALFKEALDTMTRLNLGICCVVSTNAALSGVITDGDIRRKIMKTQKPFSALLVDDAIDHAIKVPTVIHADATLIEAVNLMEQQQIWDLPVIEHDSLVGLLHLHPAVKALLNAE